MRLRRNNVNALMLAMLCGLVVAAPQAHAAGLGTAVVPVRIIYPGEEILGTAVEEVAVTNPRLAGDYARNSRDVVGLVARRTLLPGRTIPAAALREAFAVTRGSAVRLTFDIGNLTISASGTPLENAAIGDVIRVRNTDSGVTVSGTVMADGTVKVMAR